MMHSRMYSFDRIDQLSERQILDFQDLFLTNGIHYIDVESFSDARRFVASFLDSLASTKRIGCLTTLGDSLEPRVIRLYDDLALAGTLTTSPLSLETFLLEEFYYDLLWVECTTDLLSTPWFWYFERKLTDFNLGASFPVLMFYVKNF